MERTYDLTCGCQLGIQEPSPLHGLVKKYLSQAGGLAKSAAITEKTKVNSF